MKVLIKRIWKKHSNSIIFIIVLSIFMPIISNIIPKLSQHLFDDGIIKKDKDFIIGITILIIFFNAVKYLLNNTIKKKIINMNFKTISLLKKEIISSVVNLPMIFHDKNSTEYILGRVNEVDNLSNIFSDELVTFIINFITSIVAFILIVKKNIVIAICSIAFIPIFIFICKKTFTKINQQITDSLETSAKTNEEMYSILQGTMTLKQFNEEGTLLQELNSSIDKLSYTLMNKSLTVNNNTNLITFTTITIQAFLLCIVSTFIVSGELNIGDYISLGQYISLIYVPVISYQSIGISIKPALVSINRLKDLYKNSKDDKKYQILNIDRVVMKNLTFSYSNNKELIKDINLELKIGDKLLISGKNGCGKTTIAKLLLGFYDNYEGSILINGNEVKSVNEEALRDRISLLPQKCHLFNTSILENIRISNNKLSDIEFNKKIEELTELNLFDGIDLYSQCIDNGKNLSGGQIQRISLARILIRDFDMCIFDETTNSLDGQTKKIIKNIIKAKFNNKICIFISHDDYFDDLINIYLNL